MRDGKRHALHTVALVSRSPPILKGIGRTPSSLICSCPIWHLDPAYEGMTEPVPHDRSASQETGHVSGISHSGGGH